MIKVLLAGSEGRMGKEIIKLLEQSNDFSLAQGLSRPKLTDNPPNPQIQLHPADVFIDFSVKDALNTHLELCVENKLPMVIGITGLEESLLQKMTSAASKIPIIYSPNMSIGVNLMYELLSVLAEKLTENDSDIAIHEIHHKEKKDKPSGTALKMRETIIQTRNQSRNQSQQTLSQAQQQIQQPIQKDIPISALRLAKVPGEHTAIFALPDEQLELTHKAFNRSIFARGALQAAKWILGKKPGRVYNMQDVLR